MKATSAMNSTETQGQLPIITTSFLVMGNVLGVGVLALPIKCGLCGFVPVLISIVLIWAVMLIIGAIVLVYVVGDKLNIIDLVPPDPNPPILFH